MSDSSRVVSTERDLQVWSCNQCGALVADFYVIKHLNAHGIHIMKMGKGVSIESHYKPAFVIPKGTKSQVLTFEEVLKEAKS